MERPATSRFVVALAAGLAATVVAGCLVKETRSTIYLEANGSATWTILEANVHSDSGDRGEALREEADYRALQHGGWGPVAAALGAIGGQDIRAYVLRERAPFEMHTSARFQSLDRLFAGYCAAASVNCDSSLEQNGSRTTWTWTMVGIEEAGREGVEALDEAITELRIVLGSGRFVSARGFKLADPRTAEIEPDADHGDEESSEELTFSLTWENPGGTGVSPGH